jgi:hypothetical protein
MFITLTCDSYGRVQSDGTPTDPDHYDYQRGRTRCAAPRRAVARFGARFDAQGVLAGSRDSSRCIGYLTRYLTKHVTDCRHATTDAQANHAERLIEALRYEPCSPTCANWLRYGVQP